MNKLLLSTAIVAVTSMPAVAQNTEDMFREQAAPKELHASDFLGMRVYRADAAEADSYEGVQDNWDDIGEINDVIFSRDGDVEAVLVDIGGFLGIGENQVAVDMDSIRFVSDSGTTDMENDFFLVLNAPRGALEDAPTFGSAGHDRSAIGDEEQTAAAGGSTDMMDGQSSDSDMAASDEQDMTATDTAEAGDTGQSDAMDTDTAEAGDTGQSDAMDTDTAEAGGTGQSDAMDTDTAEAADTSMSEEDTAAAADEGMTADSSDAATSGSQFSEAVTPGRDGYVTMTDDELIADDLTGARAYDSNDQRIGEVSELLMSEDGKIESAIVDVGGFLGIGEKPVQLEMSKLDIMRSEDGSEIRVYIPMSEEELDSLPEYEL